MKECKTCIQYHECNKCKDTICLRESASFPNPCDEYYNKEQAISEYKELEQMQDEAPYIN